MNEFDLTFGIPMYNAEKYIQDLLECFKSTKLFSYEILIIDDGSNDNSVKICEEFRKKEIRIIRLSNNKGVSYARNCIIDNAKGKWITFIDADDTINFVEYEHTFLEVLNNDYDYYINTFFKKIRIKNEKKDNLSFLIQDEIINSPWSKFYKRDILNENNIRFKNEISLGEDLVFNLMVYNCCKRVGYLYSDMYNYRIINNESLTLKYRNNKFDELMNVNEICKAIFNKKEVLKAIEYIRIKSSISCVKQEYYYYNQEIKKTKEYIKRIKKSQKRKFIILNTLKTTLIYNFWYLMPPRIIALVIHIYNSKLSKNL